MPIQLQTVAVGLTESIEQSIAKASRNAKINLQVNSKGIDSLSSPLGKITGQADQFTKSMEAANARVLAFGAAVGIMGAVTKGFKEMVSATINVEKKMADINSVLGTTNSKLESFKKTIFEVAKDTGSSFSTVSDAALELSRQGLGAVEVMTRLKDAMILSRVSGMDAASSVEGLTAAINSFSRQGITSAEVLNKVSTAAAKYSVSERDLIEGFKRSASVASQAGMSIDELGGVITAVQEKTARGGAVIGNAFKTIFTRIQKPESLDALKSIGVAVTDAQGNIPSAMKLMEDLAKKINGLSDTKKLNIENVIAGGFQISPMIAALDDLSSETSTYRGTVEAMAKSTNEAYLRNIALNDTLAAAINRSVVSLEQLGETLGKIGITDSLKNILSFFNSFTEKIQGVLDGEGMGSNLARGIVKGIGNILSGPGIGLFVAVIAKLSYDLVKFGVEGLKTFFGIGQAAKEIANVQSIITNALMNNSKVQKDILALEGDRVAQAQYFIKLLNEQYTLAKNISSLGGAITPDVVEGTRSIRAKRGASGYIPEISQENSDIQRGVGGAKSTDRPVVIPNFAFGGGKTGTMVANTGEHMVPNYGGSGGTAIFNRDMVSKIGLPSGSRPINSARGFIPNFAKFNADTVREYASELYKYKVGDRDFYRFPDGTEGYGSNVRNVLERNPTKASIEQQQTKEKLEKRGNFELDAEADLGGIAVISPRFGKGVTNLNPILEFAKIPYFNYTDKKGNYKTPVDLNQYLTLKNVKGVNTPSGRDLQQVQGDISNLFAGGVVQLARKLYGEAFNPATDGDFTKVLQNIDATKGQELFNKATQGDIFESAGKVALNGISELGSKFQSSDQQRPFDYSNESLMKKFFGVKAARGEAKRGGDNEGFEAGKGKTFDTIIKKVFNDSFTAPKALKALKDKGMDFNFVKPPSKTAESSSVAKAARGFIPNFVSQEYVLSTLQRIKDGTSGFSKQEQETFLSKFGGSDSSGKGISLRQVFDRLDSDLAISPFVNKAYAASSPTASTEEVFKEFERQTKSNPSILRGLVKGRGYVPNFVDPLKEAISREVGAGVNPSQVYVDQHSSLKNSGNPMGLMVANRRDEPSGGIQGINRARKEGANAQTYGAAEGFIPNFAGRTGFRNRRVRSSSSASSSMLPEDTSDTSSDVSSSAAEVVEANKEVGRSMGDTVGKLIILQTVASGLTGVFDGLGGNIGKFGEGLNGVTSALMSMSMLKSMGGGGGLPIIGPIMDKMGKAGGAMGGVLSAASGFGKFLPVIGQAIFAFQGVSAILKVFGVDTDKYIKKLAQSFGLVKTPAEEAANKLRELGKVDISNILEGNFGPQGVSPLASFLQEKTLKDKAEKAGIVTKDKDTKTLSAELVSKEFEYASFQNNKQLLIDKASEGRNFAPGVVQKTIEDSYKKGSTVLNYGVGMFQSGTTANGKDVGVGVSDLQFQSLAKLEASIAARYSSKEAQQKFKTAKEAGFSPEQLRPMIAELVSSGIKNVGKDKVDSIRKRITESGDFTDEEINKKLIQELVKLDKERAPAVAAANYQEKINLELAQLRLESAIKLKMAIFDLPNYQDSSLSIEKELLSTTDARKVSIEKEIEARSRGKELIKSQVESVKGLVINSKELMDALDKDPNNDILVQNWDRVKGIVGEYADTLMQTGDSTKAEAEMRNKIINALGANETSAKSLQSIIGATTKSATDLFNIETKRLDINRKNNSIAEAYNYILTIQNTQKQESLDISLREIANAEKLNSVNDRMFKARAEGLKSITSKDVGDKIDVLTNSRERASAISGSANEQKKIFAELQKDLIKTVIDKKLPDTLRTSISGATSIKDLEPIVKNIAEAEKQAAIAKLDAAFADNKMKLDTANAARDITIDAANQFKNIVAGSKSLMGTYNSSDEFKNSPSLGNAVNVGGMYPNGALDSLQIKYKDQRNELLNSTVSNETNNKVKAAQDAFTNASNDLAARLAELDPAYKNAKKALEDNFTKSLLTFENNLAKREMGNLDLQTKKEIGSARLESKMKNPETYTGVFTQEGYLAKQHDLEMQKLRQEQDFQSKIDANTAAIELERKLYTLENITAIKDNSQIIKDLIDQLQQSQPDALKSEGTISRGGANLSPATISQMAKLVSAEVGGQGPKAQQALIETFYNRAKRDNKSIDQIVNSKAYYEPIQTGKINSVEPIPDAEIRRLIALVEDGSNISEGATDNASAGVAANAKKLYPNNNIDIGGETFYSKNIGSSNFADVSGMSSEIEKAVAGIQKMKVSYDDIPKVAMEAASNMNLQGDAQKNVAKIIAETVRQSELRNQKDKEAITLAEELYKIKLEENKAKSFGSGFSEGMRDLNLERASFKSDLGKKIPQMFSDNMATAMENAIMKGESLRDTLRDAGTSFLSEINKAMIGNLAKNFTGALFGGGLQGFAAGGKITGGSGTKDDVPSMLMGGEFVMNKRAVSKYGTGFMEQLNNGTLKHFASGGEVKERPETYQIRGGGLGSDLASTYRAKASNVSSLPQQSGVGGFHMPGYEGSGSITGKENLRAYAGQAYTSGSTDVITGGQSGYGAINLEGESIRLTNFGRNQGPMAQAIKESKGQALDLYQQQLKREAEIKAAHKAQVKAFQNQIKTTLIMSAVSAVGGAAIKGFNAGMAGAAPGAGFGGRMAAGFQGIGIGGDIGGGVRAGGLQNLFSGNYQLSQIGSSAELGSYLKSNPTSQFAKQFQMNNPMSFNNEGYIPRATIVRATGGPIPNAAGIDTVPAMLSGGEFIMNSAATQKIGAGNLNAMNSGASQSGGDSKELNDKLIAKLDELIKASKEGGKGVTVNVTSDGKKEDTKDEGGSEQDKNLSRKIKAAVVAVLQEEKRLGGVLRRN